MYTFILNIHIIFGSIACLSAAAAIWVAKGKTAHRWWGTAHMVSMAVMVLTALAMAYLKPNLFLALIAIFTAFLFTSGWARAKNRSGKPSPLDLGLAALGCLTGAGMLAVGIGGRLPHAQGMAPVTAVFGVILLLSAHDVGGCAAKPTRA